jgi:hypothetical protein
MLLSEIIYGLYVNKDMFKKYVIDKEVSDDYCNIEVRKMHTTYFLEKGYERLNDYLKNSIDTGVIIRVIKSKYNEDYISINEIPHAITDKNYIQCEQKQ